MMAAYPAVFAAGGVAAEMSVAAHSGGGNAPDAAAGHESHGTPA